MVAKKTEKANLENKKILFFEIGMVLAIAAVLVVIEWTHNKFRTSTIAYAGDDLIPDEMIIEITRQEVKQKTVPPALPEIKIVENTVDIPDENFDIDIETNWYDIVDLSKFTMDDEKAVDTDTFVIVEKMPRYHKGGLEEFRNFIQQVVEYPPVAIEHQIEGKVFVKFIVDKHGYVTAIEIQKGIHPLLDNAVIAAIKQSDRWDPGKQGNIPVNVALSMPVIFHLQ